jgi:hypothetical protein
MRQVRSAVESGSVAYSNIMAVSHEYFGITPTAESISQMGDWDHCSVPTTTGSP